MSARGLVSIDVLVELSIVALSQVSIDVVEVVSIDVVKVVSINDAHFSLRIEHSKRVGSEKKSNSSLLLLAHDRGTKANYRFTSCLCPMIGYRLENDLLKNLHPDFRMEKFRTRLSRASCSDLVGPVDFSWRFQGINAMTREDLDGPLSMLIGCGCCRDCARCFRGAFLVLLAGLKSLHVECIFSKSVDYGDILLRPEGSGIYPPETWWRRSMTRSSCSLPPLGTSFDDSSSFDE
ncbi:hypothetical protein F2Q68_00021669 [Brassica cretica]|uniref:Uncharacterized protein n=1 Tax=Brassica cretica TaxID=69181 RepID=A0A8S9FZG1_BRACR|nr:hypothetical protein F2Q68_00021669 [Brassica cretica]